MKKPLRSEYGYSKKTGWQDERDRDLYDAALLQWDQSNQHSPIKPLMKEFGYSTRTTTYDTIAYLKASEKWEKDLGDAIKRRIAAEENLKNVRSRKPYPGNFKSTPIKWDKEGYEKALEKFRAEMNAAQKGVQRTRPIHESWSKVLHLFDSTNPTRSQGAFCRWAGVKPATFSIWKNKPLTDDVERWILDWDYKGDGEGLDGSMNTNQDRK